jgi:predicted nucleic acid-binding protein
MTPISTTPSCEQGIRRDLGILALLISSDTNHRRAALAFRNAERREVQLVTTSYVLLETYALLSSRVGLAAVKAFRNDLVPLLDVVWVDSELHESGLDLLLDRGTRRLSLVDAVSFLVIGSRGVDEVFAYDRHFEGEGFKRLS